ncbi:uncharacterized protein LOC121371303 [Gigantopelta aegis]|uniref:uncharacterized protein LOC121371303 n=1 Tax=Gigantopelta aegis TaxID=1735272 RepID=UPI001B88AC81|nr:uncharacterized protein LOC121371303 [Gigantopelta aegis]
MGQGLTRIRQRFRPSHRQRRPVDWSAARNGQRQRPYQVYCRLVDPPVRQPRVDPKSGQRHFWKSPFEKDPGPIPELATLHSSPNIPKIRQVVVVYEEGHQYEVSVEPSEDDIHEDIVQDRDRLKIIDDQLNVLNRSLWDAGDALSESPSNSSSDYDDAVESVNSKHIFSSSNGDPAAGEISLVQEPFQNPWPIWMVPMESYPLFLQPFINKPCRLYLRFANSNVAPHTMEKSVEAIYLMQNVKFLKIQFMQHSLGNNQMRISIEESHRAKRGRKKGCFRPMYCKTVIINCASLTLTAIGEEFLLQLQPPLDNQTPSTFPDSNGELPKLWGHYVRELDTNPNISLEWSACLWKWYNSTDQYWIEN